MAEIPTAAELADLSRRAMAFIAGTCLEHAGGCFAACHSELKADVIGALGMAMILFARDQSDWRTFPRDTISAAPWVDVTFNDDRRKRAYNFIINASKACTRAMQILSAEGRYNALLAAKEVEGVVQNVYNGALTAGQDLSQNIRALYDELVADGYTEQNDPEGPVEHPDHGFLSSWPHQFFEDENA